MIQVVVFQAVLAIPYEINGDPLEKGTVTLEYIDWGPAAADYVGKTSATARSDVHVNIAQHRHAKCRSSDSYQ